MAFQGITDVAQAVSAVKQLRVKAMALRSLTSAIGGEVANLNTAWAGPDAQRFTNVDWPQARRQISRLAEAISGLADDLNRQISQQQQTSAR
jgi:uncharacterized protein YukE